MTITFLAIGLSAIALIVAVMVLLRADRGRESLDGRLFQLSETMERVSGAQSELGGRLQQSQATVDQRLDALTKRLGDGITQQTEKTGKTLNELKERLAVIDAAQKNISDLSQQMVGLQDILSNKQARGAFGEIQLNDLVSGILPPSAYDFQAKLSNGRIADCLLDLPNPPGPIAIDSKFPLESYWAVREAANADAEKLALRTLGADILKHVNDIAARYIVPGETAESALMFLPSEAVYAELHASLPEVVEKSFRARVWIVSPTTLMATLNTIRAVLKDVQMREQAGVIQKAVEYLIGDVNRLDKRVGNLQRHFDQTTEDMREIRISNEKIQKRGLAIHEIELEEGKLAEEIAPPVHRADSG